MPSRTRAWAGRRVMSRPAKRMRAGVGQQAAAEQADEGGLAGAVRADQRVDLAGGEVEVDAVDGREAAEVRG